MKQLKSVVLYHGAIVNPGGLERLLLEEYTFLRKAGIKTKILTFKVKEDALFNYKVTDLEVLRAKGNFLSRTIALRRRLTEINPDLIISTCSLQLYLATIFTPFSYFLHIHGSLFRFNEDLLKYALLHRGVFNEIRDSVIGHKEFIPSKPKCSLKNRIALEFMAIVDYLAVRRAEKVIVLTGQVQWEVEKLYKRSAIVARGCLDPGIVCYKPKHDIKKKLEIDDDAKIILSVSRLDQRKRIDVLIKAFAKLSKEMSNSILIVVGTGSDEKRLKSLARSLDCSDKIMFTGHVSDDELWDFYYACDVFATPAWADFDIAPFEALALGKKVVWSSEMSEDLRMNDNVIVADPSVDAFAEGIKKALMAKNNTKLDLRGFTWENYFNSFLKMEEKYS